MMGKTKPPILRRRIKTPKRKRKTAMKKKQLPILRRRIKTPRRKRKTVRSKKKLTIPRKRIKTLTVKRSPRKKRRTTKWNKVTPRRSIEKSFNITRSKFDYLTTNK